MTSKDRESTKERLLAFVSCAWLQSIETRKDRCLAGTAQALGMDTSRMSSTPRARNSVKAGAVNSMSGELDRERQPVQTTANVRHQGEYPGR